MWPLIGLIVALVAVAVLTPSASVTNAEKAELDDFNFPRADQGDPIPLLWGTVRQDSPIIIWYGDYTAVAVKKKYKTGLFSSKKTTVAYKNYMGIDMLLALGPGVQLKKIWAGTYDVWEGTLSHGETLVIDEEDLFGGDEDGGGLSGTISFYGGSFSTTQNAYLMEVLDENVPAYNGMARLVFEDFYIGTSTTPERFSFEMCRLEETLSDDYSLMANGLDVNPMEICYDVLVNDWGRLGNSTSKIDTTSFISAAETLYNENRGMSLLMSSSSDGADILEKCLTIANGILYEDQENGQIVAKLIRDDYDTGDLIILDESNIKTLKNFQKTTWENTYNQCRVTFKYRDDEYDEGVAIVQDFANINAQGRVLTTEITSNGIKDSDVALDVAAEQLSLVCVPIFKATIVATREAQDLKPGDCFILNFDDYDISNMIMRVNKVNLGELTDNQITISCVQDYYAINTTNFASSETTNFTKIDSTPVAITNLKIFVAPCFLSFLESGETVSTFDDHGRFYICADSPKTSCISMDVYTGTSSTFTEDDGTLSLESAPFNGVGILDTAYSSSVASDTRHDTTTGITVSGLDSNEIAALKDYSSLSSARDGSAMFLIDSELFIYLGYTENTDGTVTFSNLYRSVLDTEPETHAINDSVYFISGTDGTIEDTIEPSTTTYIKALARTNLGTLSLSDISASSSSMTNRAALPLPPAYITVAGSRTPADQEDITSVSVAWRNRSREDTEILVYNDSDSNREDITETVIIWSLGGDGATETSTDSSISLDVTGLTGTMSIEVYSRRTDNTSLVSNSETFSFAVTSSA